jgi:hypothetical protein
MPMYNVRSFSKEGGSPALSAHCVPESVRSETPTPR